jgi:uncharacterized repeat protein (TIGR03803 family)
MKKLLAILLLVFSSSLFTLCNAQFGVIYNFNTPTGSFPYGSLTYSSGLLYGLTPLGGTYGLGCIFSIDTNGNNYKDIYDFAGSDGAFPQFGWPGNTLTLQGNVLYGMTPVGGAGYGNIFSINTNGTNFQNLFVLDSLNGAYPFGQVVISGTVMYGMASYGGAYGNGCVFSINTDGSGHKLLFSFDTINGINPFGSLIISGNNLYGMANSGGAYTYGDIFTIKTDGTGFNDLFDFNGLDGLYPQNSLIRSGKVMYGMTFNGGPDTLGNVFAIDTDGTNYRTLLDFNSTNGGEPFGNVVLKDSLLYGMAGLGGADGQGTIFSVDTNGAYYTDLHDCTSSDGNYPIGSLTVFRNVLYGMTNIGGTNDSGVIFRYYTPMHDSGSGLGIQNITANSSNISVYPNPSNGIFTLQSSVVSGQSSVDIYNVLGQQVYSKQAVIRNSQFVIELNQPSGVYLYRVIANSGEVIGEGKLVIQK